nr:hypothetical protein [uncultured Comamonas sp.]
MMSLLKRDKIEIQKPDGKVLSGLMASVQKNKIYMQAGSIKVDANDVIVRHTSIGKTERYLVLDPGFHEGLGGIPANYQMDVENMDLAPKAPAAPTIQNIYNLTGNNPRVTHGDDHSSNTVSINQSVVQHLDDLRDAVQNAPGLTKEQVQEALEIVEAVRDQCLHGAPKKAVLKSMLDALPPIAQIASLATAILGMF